MVIMAAVGVRPLTRRRARAQGRVGPLAAVAHGALVGRATAAVRVRVRVAMFMVVPVLFFAHQWAGMLAFARSFIR